MKILHSDPWVTVYVAACPSCDLPLAVQVSCRADDPIGWSDGEHVRDECPRCRAILPRVDWEVNEPVVAA